MNRTEFLKTMGTGALAVCAACSLESCGENITPIKANFTIDISQSPYTALQNVGGSVIKDSIIIACTAASTYVALAKKCTHQGTTVQYQHSSARFHCPNHGSNYSLTGSVINGPASRSLQKLNTELTGNSLRVFSS